MNYLNRFLNNITMYKLVIYELVGLLLVAAVAGTFGYLPYPPYKIGLSTIYIGSIAVLTHALFAWAYDASSNWESTYITALILALIISPPTSESFVSYLVIATLATATAIGSKYLLTWRGAHLFNPAALGVAFTAEVLGLAASWWVATPVLAPFALIGGLLIVRKMRRSDLIIGFVVGCAAAIIFSALYYADSVSAGTLYQLLVLSPFIFFSTVMLTEPVTAPATRALHVAYGMLVGILFMPMTSLGGYHFTPETALLAGNVAVVLFASRIKVQLTLQKVLPLGEHTFEYVFKPSRKLFFRPGQYVELTVPHAHADARGIRRYFTISSPPTAEDVRFGIKFYEPSSTFKKTLQALTPGESIVAGQLAGDFTLPNDTSKKLAFIAGGIGITPFHSQLEYLRAKKERRDIVLFYSNAAPEKASYVADLEAAQAVGLRIVNAYDGMTGPLPAGAVARITPEVIAEHAPDYKERLFFISGPDRMVRELRATLRQMGVPHGHIKTDYFPGFA